MKHQAVPAHRREFSMFIDGEATTGESGSVFDVTFPLTGEVWASVAEANEEDVDNAVQSAYDRYTSDLWNSLTPTDRGDLLFEIADAIESYTDELAKLESLENGKLAGSARVQIEKLPDWFRYYGGLADKVSGEVLPVDKGSFFNYTKREPYGVVGAITTWNSPLMLAAYKIPAALAAGNTVVVKPPELAPVSTIRLAEIAHEAGLPSGALNVVPGFAEAGRSLVNHALVDKVSFTGGLETGRKVGATTGEQITSATLELGGKGPNIVFPDADLEEAVNGAIEAIFTTAGQTCIAGSRLYLHDSIHDEFIRRLVEKVESLKVGDPFDDETQVPPIGSEEQFEKVQNYVKQALDEGASLITGGEPVEHETFQNLYEPTVFTNVDHEMKIAREEVFGPVLCVFSFNTESEAIALANDSEFGLASGIWTNDIKKAVRVTEAIQTGVVWVNCYRESSFTTPFGGFKKSGVGREKGVEGLEEYTQTKSVWIKT